MKYVKRLFNPIFWLWVIPFLLIVPNVILAITETNSVWAKLTNVFLPLGVYAWLFSLSKKLGRTILLFIPVMVFDAFQIVLLALYGESIIAIDMYVNILTTSVSEAAELLGNLLGAILIIVILYVPAIVVGAVLRYKRRYCPEIQRLALRRVAYFIMSFGGLFFVFSYIFAEDFKPRREIFPYNVAENMVTAIRRTNESMHYHQTSREFTYSPVMTRDKDEPEVFVVVIGETSRADNWEIFGYERPTNPLLKDRKNIFPFSKAISEINTTHKAVPMLLSYLEPENFGDSVAHTRSIFSAFNNLGYRTAFLSNQRRNHSYIDYFGEEAQLATFADGELGHTLDFELIKSMNDLIDKSPNNKVFIVLHTYGSHFEYRKRYPSDMAHFTPDINSSAKKSNRPHLINSYDNTIRYTDALLDSVIGSLDRLGIPAAMMYVSDHGEDIFDDDRERFLHSSPTPTYYQLHVPMLVWLSDPYIEKHPGIAESLKANRDKNVASTSSLFHTLLDVVGIKTPYYNAAYSLASPSFTEMPRVYLNDYNESVPLVKSGLREQDIKVFDKNNISY